MQGFYILTEMKSFNYQEAILKMFSDHMSGILEESGRVHGKLNMK